MAMQQSLQQEQLKLEQEQQMVWREKQEKRDGQTKVWRQQQDKHHEFTNCHRELYVPPSTTNVSEISPIITPSPAHTAPSKTVLAYTSRSMRRSWRLTKFLKLSGLVLIVIILLVRHLIIFPQRYIYNVCGK